MHCVQAPMHYYCHVMAELLDTISLRERRNGTRLENTSPRTDVFQGSFEKQSARCATKDETVIGTLLIKCRNICLIQGKIVIVQIQTLCPPDAVPKGIAHIIDSKGNQAHLIDVLRL